MELSPLRDPLPARLDCGRSARRDWGCGPIRPREAVIRDSIATRAVGVVHGGPPKEVPHAPGRHPSRDPPPRLRRTLVVHPDRPPRGGELEERPQGGHAPERGPGARPAPAPDDAPHAVHRPAPDAPRAGPGALRGELPPAPAGRRLPGRDHHAPDAPRPGAAGPRPRGRRLPHLRAGGARADRLGRVRRCVRDRPRGARLPAGVLLLPAAHRGVHLQPDARGLPAVPRARLRLPGRLRAGRAVRQPGDRRRRAPGPPGPVEPALPGLRRPLRHPPRGVHPRPRQ